MELATSAATIDTRNPAALRARSPPPNSGWPVVGSTPRSDWADSETSEVKISTGTTGTATASSKVRARPR